MVFARRLISSLMKAVKKRNCKIPETQFREVVVRFPVEASGYLHIGHARSALLNQYYQRAFNGKLIVRFDDTDPAIGDPQFEQVIKEDLKMLEIEPNQWTHFSDHFELLLSFCEKLLVEGKAYVDNTDSVTMGKERDEQVESKNRNNSPQKNLELWEEMKQGTPNGQGCCVRMRMNMKSKILSMRDPTIYRCIAEEHVRTANKYKVYPTYDFACPVIDNVEGITDVLRTTEYRDPGDQYEFFYYVLAHRKPNVLGHAPLKIKHTVLSKSNMSILVNEKIVDGWDDPRMPTVRGLMRQGMTVEGLKQFIMAQAASNSLEMMEWDKIWALNKRVIEPVAPIFVALEKPLGDDVKQPLVPVTVCPTFDFELRPIPIHPKTADYGMKQVWFGPRILISQSDAAIIKEEEVVNFIRWGNMKVAEVQKKDGVVVKIIVHLDLDNQVSKNLKVAWLADKPEVLVPVKAIYYDHIVSKVIHDKGKEDWREFVNVDSMTQKHYVGEPALKTVKKGDIIKLQQKKFFICDQPAKEDSPLVLIRIPDGQCVKKS